MGYVNRIKFGALIAGLPFLTSACTGFLNFSNFGEKEKITIAEPEFVFIVSGNVGATLTPAIRGAADTNAVIIKFFGDDKCEDFLGLATKETFESTAGAAITVPASTTTSIYAQAQDLSDNKSACTYLTEYTQVTGTPTLSFVSMTPASPSATSITPVITGTTSVYGAILKFYLNDASCAGAAVATGSKADFEAGGITVSVTANSTSLIYAVVRDTASQDSACTLLTSFVHDNTPPAIAISSPSETGTDGNFDVTYTVTYTGASAVTLSNANVTLNTTGGASCTKAVTGSGLTTRTVTLSGCTGTGTVGMSIAAGTATDVLANASLAAGPSTTFSKYTAGAAAKLAFVVEPTSKDAGVTLSPSVIVEVRDASNNRVGSSTASVTLDLVVNPGGTTINGTTTASAAVGRATFNNINIQKIGTGYQIQAMSSGLANGVSQTFNITPATLNPTTIVFSVTAPQVLVGRCSGPFRLQTQDTYGNRVTQSVANPASPTIAESGAGVGLFYSSSDPGCTGTAVTSADIASASADTQFFIKHPTAESMNVTANGSTYSWGTATQAVTAQSASNVWVSRAIGSGDVPDVRYLHTAVWTGSEMIVWGGNNGFAGSINNTGGRYNPTTNSWSATQKTGAPTARDSHSAVWTGSEMIVWGGYNLAPYTNTGGRYNPTTDSWTATQTSGAPTSRHRHTAIWTGTEMIVWGGYTGSFTNTGGRYNPTSNSWTATQTTGAPTSRRDHTAVWSGTEMIVWGGQDSAFSPVTTGGRYNPTTNSWTATQTTSAPNARYTHNAVWTGTEMIVWGGYNAGVLNTGGRYNPTADLWTATQTTNAPVSRYLNTAVWTGSEMIVWGGYDSFSTYYSTGGRYNPTTDSWATTQNTNAPDARYYHTAVWTGSEMIVWGGFIGNSKLSNTGGRYNPTTDSWMATLPSGAPAGRASHTAVWTGSEMIVWGGGNGTDFFNTGGRYNPTTDSWTATQTMGAPVGRNSHAAIWTDSEMIVWGGDDGTSRLNTGGRYNPTTDSWVATQTTGAPTARYQPTAVWTGSEMIVWGSTNPTTDTGGRYNPTTDSWVATQTTGAPAPRDYHSIVWTGTEMIIWGGWTSNYSNTGGRYNPMTDSWSATQTTGAPTARYQHTAVWTGTVMIVWGGNTGSATNTGARYNPTADSWTATQTSGAPAARGSHSAIWTGSQMIVWGGSNGINTGGLYNLSGNSWTATQTTGAPVGRYGHVAVWTGTEMIVWGGNSSAVFSSNTGDRYIP